MYVIMKHKQEDFNADWHKLLAERMAKCQNIFESKQTESKS